MGKKNTTDTTKKKMKELREEIRHHDYLYYIKNNPEISDKEYDELVKKLEDLEEKYPNLDILLITSI
jgi:DNA ligase (NAD+)